MARAIKRFPVRRGIDGGQAVTKHVMEKASGCREKGDGKDAQRGSEEVGTGDEAEVRCCCGEVK